VESSKRRKRRRRWRRRRRLKRWMRTKKRSIQRGFEPEPFGGGGRGELQRPLGALAEKVAEQERSEEE